MINRQSDGNEHECGEKYNDDENKIQDQSYSCFFPLNFVQKTCLLCFYNYVKEKKLHEFI